MLNDPRKKLEELTKKISDLVPEIMKWQQGCVFNVKKPEKYTKLPIEYGNYEVIAHHKFDGYDGGELGSGGEISFLEQKYHNYTVRTAKADLLAELQTMGYLEILGRDIRLADVLLALDTSHNVPCGSWITAMNYLCYHEADTDEELCIWDLTKPLHQQSPETISFLYDILI